MVLEVIQKIHCSNYILRFYDIASIIYVKVKDGEIETDHSGSLATNLKSSAMD
jgi:hypothetical protein